MAPAHRRPTVFLLTAALAALSCCSWIPVLVVLADEMRDVAEGDNVNLECRFNSKLITPGRTNLYWSRTNTKDKDNVAISETPLEQNYEIDYRPTEGVYDLRIHNATYDRDNGKYECHAKESGSGKKLHSTTIQLTVLLPPGLPKITPPEPSATEGRSLELTCSSYGGSPDPLIKWYRSDINQPLNSIIRLGGSRKNKTSAILTLSPTRDDDNSEYRCVVWNRALADGIQLQSSVVLNVNYFPRVRVGPENPLRIEKGSPAKLSCHVDSKPAVSSVKWTRNGKFSETTFNYHIPRVSLSDAGTYVCNADNGLGQSGEADVTLDVLYAPIVSVVSKKEYEEGENVWIKCNVSSNPRPSSVHWVKEDDPSFRQSGDLLKIERASAANVGTYMCVATNLLNPSPLAPSSSEETSSSSSSLSSYERRGNASVVLLIKHAPGKTFIEPSTPYVVEGSGITLSCGADPAGWPLPQFRWWREGSENTIAIGSQLNIGLAKPTTEGTYFCQPNNEIGTGTVAHVQLYVHQAPKIITGLSPQLIRRTGDASFSVMCSAVGKPRPAISWVKDGQLIDPTNSKYDALFYKIITEDIVSPKGFYTVQSTLYFNGESRESILAADRGYYTCVFENDVKKEESHMYLRVQHKPIFQQHRSRSSTGNTGGSADIERVAYEIGDTALIPCKVQAFPKPEFDWSFSSKLGQGKNGIDSSNFDTNLTILSNELYISTLVIKNLHEEHYGLYTCKTYNQMGNSTGIIKLEPRGKPAPPAALVVLSTQISSISLAYEPGFNGGYENTKYIISYYSDKGTKSIDFDCQASNPCNVTGLEEQTVYEFKVKAYNDRGYSDYSPSVTNRTRIDVQKIPTPQNVKFEPKSATLVFNVQSNLPLHAKIEAQNLDGSWRPIPHLIPVDTDSFRYMIEERHQHIEQVRASLCVGSDDSCGKSVQAALIQPTDLPAISAAIGIGKHYMIGGIVSLIILLICFGLTIIFCCCRKKKKINSKKNKLDYEVGVGHQTQVVPPSYFSSTTTPGHNGLENKGLDRSVDIIDDTMKHFHHGNGQNNGYIISYGNGGGSGGGGSSNGSNENGGIPYIDQNSYSNSNNGGSVDSQDSLWKIAHVPSTEQQLLQQQQQQLLQHQQQQQFAMHNTHLSPQLINNYDPYPPTTQLLQQQQQSQLLDDQFQQQQQQQQQPQQYIPYDNRSSYATDHSNPYGPVPKPKRRQDLIGDDQQQQQQQHPSSYHELNGLPDPYNNHPHHHQNNIAQNSLTTTSMSADDSVRLQNNHHPHHNNISFEEGDNGNGGGSNGVAGGGYSTPNSKGRRVIREIIV